VTLREVAISAVGLDAEYKSRSSIQKHETSYKEGDLVLMNEGVLFCLYIRLP